MAEQVTVCVSRSEDSENGPVSDRYSAFLYAQRCSLMTKHGQADATQPFTELLSLLLLYKASSNLLCRIPLLDGAKQMTTCYNEYRSW